MSTRDFDVLLNYLKPVVVGREVQCFDFPLPRDIKHKPMDVRLLTNIDEEEGKKSELLSTQKKWMYSKMLATLLRSTANMQFFLAEKMKKMGQEMYHIYLTDNPDKRLKGSVV
jgi:hypothetical protein